MSFVFHKYSLQISSINCIFKNEHTMELDRTEHGHDSAGARDQA